VTFFSLLQTGNFALPDPCFRNPLFLQKILGKIHLNHVNATDEFPVGNNRREWAGRMVDSMFGELVPRGGGDPIPLFKEKLLIGRRTSCDICLPFPNISSQHCELEMKNGYWHVQDLGSSNGLKVNGMRVESKFLLPGDELAIAKHPFELQYEPLADAPPPEEEDPFSLSLMEKAGLVDRKKKRKADSSNGEGLIGDASPKTLKPRSQSSGNQQEDQIFKWLSEE